MDKIDREKLWFKTFDFSQYIKVNKNDDKNDFFYDDSDSNNEYDTDENI